MSPNAGLGSQGWTTPQYSNLRGETHRRIRLPKVNHNAGFDSSIPWMDTAETDLRIRISYRIQHWISNDFSFTIKYRIFLYLLTFSPIPDKPTSLFVRQSISRKTAKLLAQAWNCMTVAYQTSASLLPGPPDLARRFCLGPQAGGSTHRAIPLIRVHDLCTVRTVCSREFPWSCAIMG
jgi:hypothetical protein